MKPGVLAQCLSALLDAEGDRIDRDAAIRVLAEDLVLWRNRLIKG